MIKFGVNGLYVVDCNNDKSSIYPCQNVEEGKQCAQKIFDSILSEIRSNLFN